MNMGNFKSNFASLNTCKFTGLERILIFGLEPMVTEVIKYFSSNHYNEDHRINHYQIMDYSRKINSLLELLKPCDSFMHNYSSWAQQRKETIESLRKVETSLKNLTDKYNPVLKVIGPAANFMFSNFLMDYFKPSGMLTETVKKVLPDLKSEIEENRIKALRMCALDLNLIRDLGTCEFYDQMVNSINDLFDSREFLDDFLKFLESLPQEVIDNDVTEAQTCLECPQLRTCLESILPKISKLLSNGIPTACTILQIFFAVFMSRRQSCAILIHREDLGMLNNAETEVAKLIAESRVKGSKLEKVMHSEIMKKIEFCSVDVVAINLEMATIALNSIDVNGEFLIPEKRIIGEIANRLEKELDSYQKVYELLEKSSNKRLKKYDITDWTTIIIYHIPTITDENGIKNDVKPFITKNAQDCIDMERLPTKRNNWLVKVPTYFSPELLKLKSIYIANEKCLVMV